MTEHLPECMTSVVRMNYDCICPELRACEQRMREEHRHRCSGCDWCYSDGVREAIDGVREAVAALDAYYAIEECEGNPLRKGDPEDADPWHQGHLIERDDALAAIDALKEKP